MTTQDFEELALTYTDALAEVVTLMVEEAGVGTDIDAAARILDYLRDQGWSDRDALLTASSARLVYVILESYAMTVGSTTQELWSSYMLLRARVLADEDP